MTTSIAEMPARDPLVICRCSSCLSINTIGVPQLKSVANRHKIADQQPNVPAFHINDLVVGQLTHSHISNANPASFPDPLNTSPPSAVEELADQLSNAHLTRSEAFADYRERYKAKWRTSNKNQRRALANLRAVKEACEVLDRDLQVNREFCLHEVLEADDRIDALIKSVDRTKRREPCVDALRDAVTAILSKMKAQCLSLRSVSIRLGPVNYRPPSKQCFMNILFVFLFVYRNRK